jgi:adenylate cyclase
MAKHETGEAAETLRWAQLVIDLAEGDPIKGNVFLGSPLTFAIALRGVARACLGILGWRADLDLAAAKIPTFDPMTFASGVSYMYSATIQNGMLLPDATVLRVIDQCVEAAEQFGEEVAIDVSLLTRGMALANLTGAEREAGLDLLLRAIDRVVNRRFLATSVQYADIHVARARMRSGDLEQAVRSASQVVDDSYHEGVLIWMALATNVLVEALLQRRAERDLGEAQNAIDRLAAVPTDPGFVVNEIWLLRMRAMMAKARGDDATYRQYRDRYRKRSNDLGFEGHIAWAQAMS